METIEGRVAQANGRLKSAGVGVRIEARGNRLLLRAVLPPKPDSNQRNAHQQRISLGVRANPAGLKFAEAEARKIGALLACKEFDWTPYLKESSPQSQTCGDWIALLEQDYFRRRSRTQKSETTWRGDYLKVFAKLPSDQALTPELLINVALSTPPDTRSRQRYCMALGTLAKLAGLECDLGQYKGKYSPSQVTERDIPSDALIVEWFQKIKNPAWRWVYGMMATYGLRNHEVFKLDHDRLRQGDRVVTVLNDTKTGFRQVWAFQPQWWEQFELQDVALPNIDLNRPNSSIGHSVTEYFGDFGLPFTPYDLRHGWAIRTLVCGLSHELAAKQMGHSVAVHEKTYHRWIKQDVHQQAYDALFTQRR